MENTKSKVLILEDNKQARVAIKAFCEGHNLLPLCCRMDNPIEVLKSYVDLGAVFISESMLSDNKEGLEIAADIHFIRPELPIFFRCSPHTIELFKSIFLNRGICCAYQLDEIDALEAELKSNIFNQYYPNAFLRGIEEITAASLSALFPDVDIENSAPYLVKDQVIFGELLSLIPIESDWCKGFMMMQSSQTDIIDTVAPGKISSVESENFRAVNDILGELTNMVWGGIKARFIGSQDRVNVSTTQIPIIVNHANQYISFGSSAPQLCFQYTLTKKDNPEIKITLYHKFIFNINWSPEHFQDQTTDADTLIDSGELELF